MTKPSPVRMIIGIVLIVLGAVWFFQGIGVISGSLMSGASIWAIAGAIAVVAGLLVMFRPGRRT